MRSRSVVGRMAEVGFVSLAFGCDGGECVGAISGDFVGADEPVIRLYHCEPHDREVAEAAVDSDGRFSFTELDTGCYVAVASWDSGTCTNFRESVQVELACGEAETVVWSGEPTSGCSD